VYRSPSMMAGYYRDEDATRAAFRFGWFHSGDSCAYDDQGLRVMLDRYKDIVKTGGENVSSLRVEAVLGLHPGVAKSAVLGLPHPHGGEGVTAVVMCSRKTARNDEQRQTLNVTTVVKYQALGPNSPSSASVSRTESSV